MSGELNLEGEKEFSLELDDFNSKGKKEKYSYKFIGIDDEYVYGLNNEMGIYWPYV